MNSGEAQETAIKEEAGDVGVGGEIHIIADARTGEVKVRAPQNLLVALGILDIARVVLVQQHHEAQRRASQRAELVRATSADLGRIQRPS